MDSFYRYSKPTVFISNIPCKFAPHKRYYIKRRFQSLTLVKGRSIRW
jgi:hypothetical protein